MQARFLTCPTPARSRILSALPGLMHGFSGKELPEAEQRRLESVVSRARQVHGTELIFVERPEQRLRDADAIATFTPGLPVGVSSADCAPLLVAACDEITNNVYGVLAVHAGWRGTALQAGALALEGFAAEAVRRRAPGTCRFVAAIGPCISFDRFEVGPEVLAAFPAAESQGLARPLRLEDGRQKYLLDLAGENSRQLREKAAALGLRLELEALPLCTVSLSERFPSYRREGKNAGRILSFLEFAG